MWVRVFRSGLEFHTPKVALSTYGPRLVGVLRMYSIKDSFVEVTSVPSTVTVHSVVLLCSTVVQHPPSVS